MAMRSIYLAILGLFATGLVMLSSGCAQGDSLPYWVSLEHNETRMRVGPSREYPIAWVYRRKGLPLKVLRVLDEWKLVEDSDGAQGWVAGNQLSLQRTVLVTGEGPVDMRQEPDRGAVLRWQAQAGVVGKLLECRAGWCDIDVAGRTGWIQADRLWGDEELAAQP